MKIIKSLFILSILLMFIFLSIILISNGRAAYKKNILSVKRAVALIICLCLTITAIALFGDYVYPFERNVNLVLVASFDVAEGYELEYAGERFWHGAYEEYGIYPASMWWSPDNGRDIIGVDWPPLALNRNNYIISYGQKVESLSYNVWDKAHPKNYGAFEGHVILSEEFDASKVYIYRIPKVRIDIDHSAWNEEITAGGTRFYSQKTD